MSGQWHTCSDLQAEEKLRPFVAINVEKNEVHIRKTTAIWLLQDSEHVPSDRIFHVRSKQSNEPASKGSTINEASSTIPILSSYLVIGDVNPSYSLTSQSISILNPSYKYLLNPIQLKHS